jgi:hypothetical protein
MSYQARMAKPPLRETGRTGALGNTKRTGPIARRSSSRAIGTKSLPSAPRPCSTMMEAAGVAAGSAPLTMSRVSRKGVFMQAA